MDGIGPVREDGNVPIRLGLVTFSIKHPRVDCCDTKLLSDFSVEVGVLRRGNVPSAFAVPRAASVGVQL
jgi:hypothetical protein